MEAAEAGSVGSDEQSDRYLATDDDGSDEDMYV